MDRKKKGRRFELWVRDWLKAQGYAVYLAGKKAAKIGGQVIFKGDDIFGCDMVAISDKPPHHQHKIRFIQASLHGGKKKRLEKITGLPWPLDCASVELWLKPDSTINVNKLSPNGKFELMGKIIKRKFYRIENGQ